MPSGDHNTDFGGQADSAVAAKTIPEQGSIIVSALHISGAVEGFLNLAAKLFGLIVQALLHQYHVNYIFRPRSTKISFSLHHLTNYELKSLHICS
jgi:hypothetical protein